MSIGIVEMQEGLTSKTLEAGADEALCQTKHSGRNRLQLARS